VWLTGADINDPHDATVILDLAGTATKEGADFPFEASLTIGQNRVVVPPDPALPGSKPICKQRVVTPIPADFTPSAGGRLVVRVDPRGLFSNVEFDKLAKDGDVYRFADSSEDQPSKNLYGGLRASTGVYALRWEGAAE
jgi:hypothetical protein